MCSILGYSFILCFSIACYIILISLITLTDTTYLLNGTPKVNLYKVSFLFFLPTWYFIYIGLTCNAYAYNVVNHGLKASDLPGWYSHIFVNSLLTLIALASIMLLVVYLTDKNYISILASDFLLFLLLFPVALYPFAKNRSYIFENKPPLSDIKQLHLKKMNSNDIAVVKSIPNLL